MDGWQSVEFYSQFLTFGNACVAGLALAWYKGDFKSRNYFICLALFIYGYSMVWPYIKGVDDLKVFRYITNSASQLMFAVLVMYLANRSLTSVKLAVAVMCISILIVFAQFYRVIDRHVFDLPYAHFLIVDFVQYMNAALVLAGYVSLMYSLYNKFEQGKKGCI